MCTIAICKNSITEASIFLKKRDYFLSDNNTQTQKVLANLIVTAFKSL